MLDAGPVPCARQPDAAARPRRRHVRLPVLRQLPDAINTMHLFSEHNSTRVYTDPEGWADHEANCAKCGPQPDDE